MTLVGKIFIVLILIMSVVFMTFAICVYATHQNWKDLVTSTNPARPGLRQQVAQINDDNNRLRSEIEQLKNRLALERAARTYAISVLEQQTQEKEAERQEAVKNHADLLEQNRTAIQNVETAQAQLAQLVERVTNLRAEVLKAQQDRDASFLKVRELTDTLHQAEGVLSRLRRRNDELVTDLAQATTVLKAHDLTVNSPVTNIPPAVDGIVTKVDSGMIEMSIGEDDGLKPGHTVEVSRRDKYLGRALVTRVDPDKAIGRLLDQYGRAPVQEGDSVQTKVR